VSAAILADSIPRRAILKACDTEDVALSLAVWNELIEVLNRPRLARYVRPALREDVLTNLIDAAVWVAPMQPVTECRDAKDNKYLELALASAATRIVTSDNDLLVLDPWRGIRILRPAEYLASG
jgi:putative PIN family toxin of toxin-antitoxin system